MEGRWPGLQPGQQGGGRAQEGAARSFGAPGFPGKAPRTFHIPRETPGQLNREGMEA